jgi:4-hydroxybenzoate polyprenyltransferase
MKELIARYRMWLYLLGPVVVGFVIAGNIRSMLLPFLAAAFWFFATYAFLTLPTLSADKKAGHRTIGLSLGIAGTLWFSTVLYVAAALLSYPSLGKQAVLIGVIYTLLMIIGLWISHPARIHKANLTPEQRMRELAHALPMLNALAGLSIFLGLVK